MNKRAAVLYLSSLLILVSSCSQGAAPNTQSSPTKTSLPVPSTTPAPIPVNLSWNSIGPGGGGWLTSLAFAPPNTIYVGCNVGGVYRSYDGGENWQIINEGLANYAIYEIKVDASDPSIIYLGTMGGVFKSTDGGDQWDFKGGMGIPPMRPGHSAPPISSLAIDPTNPTTIFAGVGVAESVFHIYGQGAIYKSTDAGENWQLITSGTQGLDPRGIIYDIIVHPQNSQIVYASTDYGFYRSADGGLTWEPSNDGLPHTNTRRIAIDTTNPEVLYLTIHSPPGQSPWQGGVYKSVDGGTTWTAKSQGLEKTIGEPDEPDPTTTNYWHIVIDPANPKFLYVASTSWRGAGVYKTTNGGDSWSLITRNSNMTHGWDWEPAGVQPVEPILIDPTDPERLYIGGPFELHITEDSGATWQQVFTNETPPESGWWKGRGLETTVINALAVDPTNSNNVYIGFADIGFYKSENGGQTFKETHQGLNHPGNFFQILVDPQSPNVIYASTGRWEYPAGDVVRSEDFGETWTVIGTPASGLPDSQVYRLVMDPTSPVESRRLYAISNGNGLYISADGGMNWTRSDLELAFTGDPYAQALVIDPLNASLLYASDMNGMYKSTDAGMTWGKFTEDMYHVRDIEINPENSQTIFVATLQQEGSVYRSRDGGLTWELVFVSPSDEFLFVKDLVVDPLSSDVIYLTTVNSADNPTGGGVFTSTDGGDTWQPVNEGLSHLSISVLKIDPGNSSILYVGSTGNGVFRGIIE